MYVNSQHYELQLIGFRGAIIHECIILERHIDIILAKYFSVGDRRSEIMELILCPRLSFSSKKEILDFILKSHSHLLTEYIDFLNDLTYIIEQRNILAHYMHRSFTELEQDESGFIFNKTKNNSRTFVFTDEEQLDLFELIKKSKMFLVKLIDVDFPV